MKTGKYILGISAFAHDSSACLLFDSQIIAFCEEERLNRQKHTSNFPIESIRFCLKQAQIQASDLSAITFFWRPHLEIIGNLAHVAKYFPESLGLLAHHENGGSQLSFFDRIHKIYNVKSELKKIFPGQRIPLIYYCKHHNAHAASAFHLSPFPRAAILSIDGRGEYNSTLFAIGDETRLRKIHEIKVPHSLGHFYTAITAHLGFKPFVDEWKVMGLSAYGKPTLLPKLRNLLQLEAKGFSLNLSYFAFHTKGARRWFSEKFYRELGPPLQVHSDNFEFSADLAFAAQRMVEEAGLHLAELAYKWTKSDSLCMAGGVTLNCLMNERILKESHFERVFFQPISGDAGTSLGSALYFSSLDPKWLRPQPMRMPYWGPAFTDEVILAEINSKKMDFEIRQDIVEVAAKSIADGKIVGWFQGNMECGPRALGNRSILADPRNFSIKEKLNKIVKRRESFRPFAPAVVREHASSYFELPKGAESPYMILTGKVKEIWRRELAAITHVDGTARVQTVDVDDNPLFHRLISTFGIFSGIPIVLNTSFNENEPIVCRPSEAIDCFLRTEIDVLCIGSYVLKKP